VVASPARPVVVTGIGIVAPTGVGRAAFWSAVCDARPALGPLTRFDATGFPSRVAGQVPDGGWADRLEARVRRTSGPATQLLLAAGLLALEDAGVAPGDVAPERRGVQVGTALGGWRTGEEQLAVVRARGARRANPFLASGAAPYTPGAALATSVGAEGLQTSFTTGCTASLQAIAHGAAAVASDDLDLCLAGGVEWPLAEVVVAGMGRTRELYGGDDAAAASRPFDARHAGMVLSEGACVLVLEPLDQATARGVRPLARVLGAGDSCDARGLYGSDPGGTIGARAVRAGLRRAGRTPADVGWVCAHANSAPAFDHKETAVLRSAFGDAVARVPVSSIKGVLGHPLGAAGAFQTAAAALALADGRVPPTANLERPAPGCELAHVTSEARALEPHTVLVTSYGYGGVNACLVLGEA
jgi:3-oxoacyl-(acyl-carrier-protein) synthase